jgi:hypothetical protein
MMDLWIIRCLIGFALLHRWFHIKNDGGMFMVAARVNAEDRKAGQMDYNHRSKNDLQSAWGTDSSKP